MTQPTDSASFLVALGTFTGEEEALQQCFKNLNHTPDLKCFLIQDLEPASRSSLAEILVRAIGTAGYAASSAPGKPPALSEATLASAGDRVQLDDATVQTIGELNSIIKRLQRELDTTHTELNQARQEVEAAREEIRRGNEATARANADLENLLRSTKLAAVFLDDESRVRIFTPAIEDIYGLIDNDLGQPLEQIASKVETMPPLPDVRRLVDGRAVEHTVMTQSGKFFIRRVLPFKSHTGTSGGVVVTFTDISELRRSEEAFQLLVDASSQIVWITDAQGRVLEDSPSWRAFTGQSLKEWMDSHWLEMVHCDDRDATIRAWRYAVERSSTFSTEYRLRDHTGQYVWMHVRAVAQRDSNGRVSRWVGMNTDISERKRRELELATAKARLELSLEVSDVAPWNWDTQNGRIVSNPTLNRLFAFPEDATPSLSEFIDRIHPKDQARVSDAIERSMHAGVAYDEEYAVLWPDNQIRHLRARGSSWLSATGELEEFFGVVINITYRKQRELDAIDREAHLRRVIDNTLNFIGVLDTAGTLLEVNSTAIKAGGITREDVVGKKFWDCYWWSFDEAAVTKLRESFDRALSGEVVRYDASVRMAGDSRMMIDFMLAPVFNEHGQVEMLIPSGIDISERHAAAAQLAESKRHLAMAMKAAQMGSFLWDRVTDQAVWDDQWCDLVGVSDDMPRRGKTFHEMIHPEDQDRLQKDIEESLIGNAEFKSEFRIIRTDGELRWLAAAGDWGNDEHGSPRQLTGLNWDITDQKEYENQMRISAELNRVAAGAAGFGTFHVDLDNNYVVWSEEIKRVIGASDETKLTSEVGEIPEFVHPDDHRKLKAHVDMVLADMKEPDHWLVHRIIRGNGEVRHVRMQTRTLYDESGRQRRVKMVVGTLLDITKQHDFETQLKRERRLAQAANAAKSQFVANMSHEIRTPMTAILGYADLLRSHIAGEEAKGFLNTIRRNGDYLLDIINDILDLSKIEAGKLEVDVERFPPDRVIEDVRSIMQVRATEKGLDLNVEYASRIPKLIESDAKRLKQVLINLVGNAIKFTNKGQIRFVVDFLDSQTPQLRLRIIDSGIGMTVEQRKKLFKPFSQGDSLITQQFGGTGLGLAISQRLAAMLSGTITVDSEINKGSTFTVTIATGDVQCVPMVMPTDLSHTPEEEAKRKDVRLNCHVLIVDDRRDIRFLSNRILTQAGASADQCEDGLKAIKYFRNCLSAGNHPDLILLDMQMPNLDGYETALELRQLGYTGPIIALTADAMQGDMSRCIDAGCDDYLSKPINAIDLLNKVAELT